MYMTILTPTRFRQRLFSTLHRAVRGETIAIHTREGDVYLHSGKKPPFARRRVKEDPMAQKIPGWISPDFEETADKALREYIRLPS
jgi:hypothetical protein